MRLSKFEYQLSTDLIAQHPKEKRDESRLMVLDKENRVIKDNLFKQIINYIKPGDTIIANNTKVFPARLHGRKDRTGAKIEVFLLRKLNGNMWEVLVKPSRKVRVGNKIYFDDEMHCDVIDNTSSGGRTVEFNYNGRLMEKIYNLGNCPLPPYIKREAKKEDILRYQTVYAEKIGAVAATTAGL
ncbi:MAG: S-adenosylmethionine:tRNA ribosyltransferase-isomerase, partial [Calditrichia bacterium]|nr:S-adenosylmethionine:tRNA ribosyltransferase-isomerase [Calditrichia bacterium]